MRFFIVFCVLYVLKIIKENYKLIKWCVLTFSLQIYRGPHCSFRASGLLHGTEYQVRVFAIRLAKELEECELVGNIGLPTTFATVAVRPVRSGTGGTSVLRGSTSSAAPSSNPGSSDQGWAILLLVTFTLCAVLIAFLTQQVLLYAASSSSTASVTMVSEDADILKHVH